MEQKVVRLYISYYPLEIYNNSKIFISVNRSNQDKTKYPNERHVPHRWTIHNLVQLEKLCVTHVGCIFLAWSVSATI